MESPAESSGPQPSNTIDPNHVVSMHEVVKRFASVTANDKVNFDLKRGEIHALLGENGAGKTTLMNMLFGLLRPDEGKIYVKGDVVNFRTPLDAMARGIGMVHQHFALIDPLTVAENAVLGSKSGRGLLDVGPTEKGLAEISRKHNLKVDLKAKVWQLSVGEKQRAEIARTLYRGADVLILDEPTSVLTPTEVNELFMALRSMVAKGNSVIFITHKLNEVMTISDRVTVLRDGRLVGRVKTSETTERELAKMMIGRELLEINPVGAPGSQVVLEVTNLRADNDKGLPALRGVTLKVNKGEILGVAGVSGNGQKELAECIAGLRKTTGGTVSINGENFTNRPPGQIIKGGLAYIPEDRLKTGLILEFSVAENLVLKRHGDEPFSKRFLIERNEVRDFAARLVEEYDIRTPGIDTPVKNLSGGNNQKVILARELSMNPRLVVAAGPTKGLDAGATEFVRNRLVEERSKGAAIVLISEDLDEVLDLSDRVAVMYEGRIMADAPRVQVKYEEIGLMMGGVSTK